MANLEFKGQKGRWYLQKFTDAYTNIIRCDDGKGMETIYLASTGQSTNEKERCNARLMAAAKDLFEACKMARTEIAKGTADTLTVDVLEKAILKALEEN